jgi:hypothetical protein
VSLDEAGLRDRMRRLREIDEHGLADVRRACDAIDQILDVQQQARFRVFEEQMERRKVELVLRAPPKRPREPSRRLGAFRAVVPRTSSHLVAPRGTIAMVPGQIDETEVIPCAA